MKIALLFTFATGAFASPLIITDVIPLAGSGSWFRSVDQNGSTVSAYGNMNGHNISLSYESCMGGPSGLLATTGGGCSYDTSPFGAFVDDIRSHFFSFTLFDGQGNLSLFDSSRNLLASVGLAGQIEESSHADDSPYTDHGTFNIVPDGHAELSRVVPNPEPGTLLLLATGAMLIGVRGIAVRRAKRLLDAR